MGIVKPNTPRVTQRTTRGPDTSLKTHLVNRHIFFSTRNVYWPLQYDNFPQQGMFVTSTRSGILTWWLSSSVNTEVLTSHIMLWQMTSGNSCFLVGHQFQQSVQQQNCKLSITFCITPFQNTRMTSDQPTMRGVNFHETIISSTVESKQHR